MDKKCRVSPAHECKLLAILLACALLFGVYKVSTAILISRDAVWYIERAQVFASDPMVIVRSHPFGFPAIIYCAHTLARLAVPESRLLWVYCAQVVSFGCFILACIPLYYLWRLLKGASTALQSIVVMLLLPAFWENALNALRDWPAILFVAVAFFLIVRSRDSGGAWYALSAGFTAGLGVLIRPECVHLLILGVTWWGVRFLREACPAARCRSAVFLLLLIVGFLIPAGPYGIVKIGNFHQMAALDEILTDDCIDSNVTEDKAASNFAAFGGAFGSGFWKTCEYVFENLAWYFAPFWIIGGYCYLRSDALKRDGGLILLFLVFQVLMFMGRYFLFSSFSSSRYYLTMLAVTIFFIPMGFNKVASCLNIFRTRHGTYHFKRLKTAFLIFILPGVVLCAVKMIPPLGYDKLGYRQAAEWLRLNTPKDALIAVPDRRIYFYANRTRLLYSPMQWHRISPDAVYLVDTIGSEEKDLESVLGRELELCFETPGNPRRPRGRPVRVFQILK